MMRASPVLRRRSVVVAVCLATIGVAGCRSGSEPAGSRDPVRPGSSPSSTTASESTNTTEALLDPAPSRTSPTYARPTGPVAAPDPPALRNVGEDYGRIFKNLLLYIAWLGVHPDKAEPLLANALVPGSTAYDEVLDAIRRAREAGLHYSDQPEALIGYTFKRVIDPSNVEIEVVLSTNLERTSRADGSTYASTPGYQRSTHTVVLHRDDPRQQGPWRISVNVETERIPWPSQ